jgi:hypothetical protein
LAHSPYSRILAVSVLREIPRRRLASLMLPPACSKAAAVDHAFTVWKKDRVISIVHPENRASIRLVERIGESLLDRIEHLGREMLCYGVDREGWAAWKAWASKRLRAASSTAA